MEIETAPTWREGEKDHARCVVATRSANVDRNEILGEFEHTIEDALAVSLKRIMAQNGAPQRRDYVDMDIFHVHARQWDDALKALRAYDARMSASQ